MIGQHITATLWSVSYSYEAPRSETTQRFVTGDTLILTADPTGDDLRQVTERFVMGAKPVPGHSKFLLTVTRRISDVVGLAQLVAHDRGWPAELHIGAVVLDAGTRQQAAIGDLSRRLALANAEIAALKAENEGLYRIAKLAWAVRTTADPEAHCGLDEALDYFAKVAMPARFERAASTAEETSP